MAYSLLQAPGSAPKLALAAQLAGCIQDGFNGMTEYLRRALLPVLLALGSMAGFVQAEEPPIRIGILHSLTGTMAISETTLKDAMLMLIERQNARGGLLGRPLEAVVVDPASDWNRFADKARELIDRHEVVVVFGGWTSASRKAVVPVFEEANSLLFYPVQYEGQESSRNVIYTGAVPNQQALPAIDYLMDVDGNRELIYEGAHNIWHAIPLKPRPVPPAHPDRVAWPGRVARVADVHRIGVQPVPLRREQQTLDGNAAAGLLVTDGLGLECLDGARRRGVDVRVIVPMETDHGPINRSNVLAVNLMLEYGIRVFIYPGFSHVKASVYDGWVCVGSANFDRLSLHLNRELNISSSAPEVAEQLLERLFEPDFRSSLELTEPIPKRWVDHLVELIADYIY